MERKTLIIMTKSSKYHGNCVTGIDIQSGKWVRLMTHDEESKGAVPDVLLHYADGSSIEVLDTVSAPIEEWCGDHLHPENYFLDENLYFEKIRASSFSEVLNIHPDEKRRFIFNNALPFVDLEHINYINYSLCLVQVSELKIYEQTQSLGKKKWKASFVYNDNEYKGIAMTDPKFYHSVSGTMYKNAYVVISIGTPWEGKYYKYLSAIFVQKNSRVLPVQDHVESESVDIMEINVETSSDRGIAVFKNYEAFKKELIARLSVFKTGSYSSESMQDAIDDREALKTLKNKLTEKRKEIEKIANTPFASVKEQLDELIELVKEPYKLIDEFIKEQEKRTKRDIIFDYARDKARVLGDYSEDLISSRSFFNPRWLNASYVKRKWQKDIDLLVEKAQTDLSQIDELPEDTIAVARTQYFDTLSYSSVESFLKSYTTAKKKESEKTQKSLAPELHGIGENEKSSAVFRVEGTKEQINQGYSLLKQVGLSVEILSKGSAYDEG